MAMGWRQRWWRWRHQPILMLLKMSMLLPADSMLASSSRDVGSSGALKLSEEGVVDLTDGWRDGSAVVHEREFVSLGFKVR